MCYFFKLKLIIELIIINYFSKVIVHLCHSTKSILIELIKCMVTTKLIETTSFYEMFKTLYSEQYDDL